MREPKPCRIGELPTEIAEAIQSSKMDPAHEHLNALWYAADAEPATPASRSGGS
jgi:hypothetical protein